MKIYDDDNNNNNTTIYTISKNNFQNQSQSLSLSLSLSTVSSFPVSDFRRLYRVVRLYRVERERERERERLSVMEV